MDMLRNAVNILRKGGLVAIPTETVYGLGADARNSDAIRKIFSAKGRPSNHPLIVHIADASQLTDWAIDISQDAYRLADAYWPGPLTLILKKSPQVLDLITGGQDTIGIRVPSHPVAQELLREFGSGIAAPSANLFGRISPTTAEAVQEELGDVVDLILEGGMSEIGLESTIIDVSHESPVLLRPGMISVMDIEQTLQKRILRRQVDSPRVSGSLASHYAPQTETYLISPSEIFQFLQKNSSRIALVARTIVEVSDPNVEVISMPDDAKAYAHDLYQTLRFLDQSGFEKILIETVPEDSEWDAIRDRLIRATR